jgi:hypothetical protein
MKQVIVILLLLGQLLLEANENLSKEFTYNEFLGYEKIPSIS